MKLVNLTPHDVDVHTKDGEILTIDPENFCARLHVDWAEEGTIEVDGKNIELYSAEYSFPRTMPKEEEGTIYIVSWMFKRSVGKDRPDMVSPGEAIRDDRGFIVGCKGLQI